MKRFLLITAVAVLVANGFDLTAQNLVSDAVRQELDDRLRRAERDLEAVKEANDALRKKLGTLQTTTDSVSEAAARAATSSKNILSTTASKEELNQLREALKESEHRREADKKLFLEKFDELRKLMVSAPTAPSFSSAASSKSAKERPEQVASPRPKSASASGPDTGVYHVVEKNQTALEILKAYNDDQKSKGHPGKITLRQLEAANPSTNMDRLRSGQKLFIPIPDK